MTTMEGERLRPVTNRPAIPGWHAKRSGTVTPGRPMVQRWLDAYVRAWQSYEETAIADLWTEDATWLYPFGVRAQGRAAITAEWMAEKDAFAVSAYDAHYELIAIDGDIAVTHGRTRFFDAETGEVLTDYDNVWVLRFGPDGRCAEFHEWYAARPKHGGQGPDDEED
jgi:ketosteroid isomerase-like protein